MLLNQEHFLPSLKATQQFALIKYRRCAEKMEREELIDTVIELARQKFIADNVCARLLRGGDKTLE